ncbi:MAG: DUF29 domain-containing protein [Candidatus Contendobacter sp.]
MNAATQTDYEHDFYRWTQTQAALLRQGKLAQADLENIAEEIESMGKSDKRAISSYLHNILLHLLKWQYQSSRRSRSWENSIDNNRRQVERITMDSPSLHAQIPDLIVAEYALARRSASRQTRLPLTTFPEICPFSTEQVTGDYWPA